jgi:hypothetical protein
MTNESFTGTSAGSPIDVRLCRQSRSVVGGLAEEDVVLCVENDSILVAS